MSHLRPEERTFKKGRASCRKGRHHYGQSRHIGGGIVRRVCITCGEVSIDLTGAEPFAEPIVRPNGKIGNRQSDS